MTFIESATRVIRLSLAIAATVLSCGNLRYLLQSWLWAPSDGNSPADGGENWAARKFPDGVEELRVWSPGNMSSNMMIKEWQISFNLLISLASKIKWTKSKDEDRSVDMRLFHSTDRLKQGNLKMDQLACAHTSPLKIASHQQSGRWKSAATSPIPIQTLHSFSRLCK